MTSVINGHKMRRLRAEKIWEQWARDFYVEGKLIEEIQAKYRRKNGKLYTKSYIYQRMEIVKDRVINVS